MSAPAPAPAPSLSCASRAARFSAALGPAGPAGPARLAAARDPPSVCGSSARVDANVHIGGYLAAANPRRIQALGITHILKLFRDDASYFGGVHRHPGVEYLVIDAADEPGFPLARHFDECLSFIQRAIRAGGQVLVHCHAGVSRSATIVLLHLMIHSGMDLGRAWALLRQKRPAVSPNPGFWRLLEGVDQKARRFRLDDWPLGWLELG